MKANAQMLRAQPLIGGASYYEPIFALAQNLKLLCVVQRSDQAAERKQRLSANPFASFSLLMSLAGFIFLLFGTSALRADFLAKSFWVNSAFEMGSDLDQTTGTVSNWNRGGNDPTICQVIADNSVSSSHSDEQHPLRHRLAHA